MERKNYRRRGTQLNLYRIYDPSCVFNESCLGGFNPIYPLESLMFSSDLDVSVAMLVTIVVVSMIAQIFRAASGLWERIDGFHWRVVRYV